MVHKHSSAFFSMTHISRWYSEYTMWLRFDATEIVCVLEQAIHTSLGNWNCTISDPLAGILGKGDLPNLLDILRSAVPRWRNVGVYLGFDSSELDSIGGMPQLIHEGRPGYFREMLSQWLKWAPPNHPPPTVLNLASALRRTGEEATALQMERVFGTNGLLCRSVLCISSLCNLTCKMTWLTPVK